MKGNAIGTYELESYNSNEYDLAFVLYHEMKAHVEQNMDDPDKEHEKFGNKGHIPGMSLWGYDEFNEKNVMVVEYGTDAWDAFKQILSQKVTDGKGSSKNKEDLIYMNNYEKKNEKVTENK